MEDLFTACLGVLTCLLLALVLACEGSNDDDDNDVEVDDDTVQVDDDAAVDDDDDDDNDTAPYTCEQVAGQLRDVCQMQTNLTPDLEEWCNLSETLFDGKLQSPFWNCMGQCAFVENCEEACFDACTDPADPGGDGCDHTVNGIYACGVVFVFEANPDYWMTEMDAMAVCSTVLAEYPWECFAQCVAAATCSDPPTPTEAQALADCMTACR